MSTTKHTPGPWTRSAQFINDADGAGIAEAFHVDRGSAIDNARLIAAAPELLAALQLTVEKFGQLPAHKITLGQARALSEARDAIAKATEHTS